MVPALVHQKLLEVVAGDKDHRAFEQLQDGLALGGREQALDHGRHLEPRQLTQIV